MKNTLCCALVALFFAACTSGSAVVSGERRPPVDDWTSIAVLDEMPPGGERVTVVKASSSTVAGAIAKLKRQAADAGANNLIIESTWSEKGVASTSRDGNTRIEQLEVVRGIAVYVDE